MNLTQLGEHIARAKTVGDINQPTWFMGDGSNWDATQHRIYMEAIDRRFGTLILEKLAHRLDIPTYMYH